VYPPVKYGRRSGENAEDQYNNQRLDQGVTGAGKKIPEIFETVSIAFYVLAHESSADNLSKS